MIVFKHYGSFKNTEKFLTRNQRMEYIRILNDYGTKGVSALQAATPVDSGETANAWAYEIKSSSGSFSIVWTNSNVNKGVPIAIIIQYGHGTRNGGYVQGRDYINPALKPLLDRLADEVWREVTNV